METKVAKRNIILSKESGENEVRAYFNAILALAQGKEEFPTNLDEVWMLVYGRKEEAVRALTSDFIQDVDYQFLRKNAENSKRGRPTDEYKLSISCLEYFIARKVRPVFEVYRQVFHHSVPKLSLDSITRKDLALMLVESEEEKERLQLQVKEQAPKVLFADAVSTSQRSCLIAELAKILQ